ncbi:MAG: cobalt ECF transporter T component CbiQ [Anaerolineales bacterium]
MAGTGGRELTTVAIASGAYLAHESAIHQLDPRTKLIAALMFVLSVALLPEGSWLGFMILYLGWLLITRLARVPVGMMWRRSLWAAPFLLAALALPFSTGGSPMFQVPLLRWTATDVGLIRAATLVLRTWISVQGFLLLAATTTPEELLWSLQVLRVPALLVTIIGFTYRYLQLLSGEATRMLRARRARSAGGSQPAALRLQIRSMGSLVGSLFLRALERSERVYAAMLSRGYSGEIYRLETHDWDHRDILSLLVVGVWLVALVGLTYWGR